MIIQMKTKIVSAILLGSILSTSCVDLNQRPNSFITEEDYIGLPQDIQQVQKAATGLYNDLWGENYGFNCRMQAISCSADELVTSPKPNNRIQYLIDLNPSVGANDKDVSTAWKIFWKVVSSSNKIINGTPIPSDPAKATEYKAVVAEAHFMRALAYFYLVRIFGDVPMVLTTAAAPADAPRVGVSEIYNKVILPDLEYASEFLPAYSRSTNSSTPSKWAAKAMLADVHMNMAGWPLKLGATSYAKAAQITKEIIQEGGLSLTPEYSDLFKEANKAEANEHLFAIHHISKYNASNYGKSYYPSDFAPNAGWADYYANPDFMNKYPQDDRKAHNFMTSWNTKTGIVQWQDSKDKLPSISKYYNYDEGAPGKSAQSNGLTVIYRYADVLLMYAEASARAEGTPNADAYNALHLVQKRANAPETPAGLNQDAFVKAVLAERGWEFFAEMKRWFDLVRTETVAEIKPDEYAHSLFKANNHYYMPIPSEQVQMAGWANNSGY